MAVDALVALYQQYGAADYIGEPLTQTEHGLQAAYFAQASGAPPGVIAAALLHDVGHLVGLRDGKSQMGDLGTRDHENVGGDYLQELGLMPMTVELVRSHVIAKRYLTGTQPAYLNKLSDASRQTLMWQGGPMTPTECAQLDANPLKKWILLMRTWDDKAKVKGLKVPDFDSYMPLLKQLLVEPKVDEL